MPLLKVNGKKLALGCLAGALLALVSPWLMLTQLFAELPLVMLPALALTAIHRSFGRLAAGISGMLVMLSFGYFTGSTFMWAMFLMLLNPLTMLLRIGDKPFFVQMKHALVGFGLGLLMAVLMFYLGYGGKLVERLLGVVPELLHSMPQEAVEASLAAVPGMAGYDAASFLKMVDDLFAHLIPSYSLHLPGRLFSGALITAVLCTLLSNRMQKKAGSAKPGCYVPLLRWYMPPSMTGGLALILLISAGMHLAGIQGGNTVFYAVLDIAVWAFVFQALAYISRRMNGALSGHGVKIFLPCMLLAIAMLGGAPYIAVYGFLSAMLGEKGALRLIAEQKKNKDNDDSDTGND